MKLFHRKYKIKTYKKARSFLWNSRALKQKIKREIAAIRLGFSKRRVFIKQTPHLSLYNRHLICKRRFSGLYGLSSANIKRPTYKPIPSTSRLLNRNQLFQIREKIISLESRLEMCLFRMQIFASLFAVRQAIRHGFVYVNFQRMNLGNHLLKPGDFIGFSPRLKKNFFLANLLGKTKRFLRNRRGFKQKLRVRARYTRYSRHAKAPRLRLISKLRKTKILKRFIRNKKKNKNFAF